MDVKLVTKWHNLFLVALSVILASGIWIEVCPNSVELTSSAHFALVAGYAVLCCLVRRNRGYAGQKCRGEKPCYCSQRRVFLMFEGLTIHVTCFFWLLCR